MHKKRHSTRTPLPQIHIEFNLPYLSDKWFEDMWGTNEMFRESHYFEFICKVHRYLINEHVAN